MRNLCQRLQGSGHERFRDQLPHHPLTLADWVLGEKDLVGEREKPAA